MTIEEWRMTLYPLGFLSGLIFTTRFIAQWIESEKQKKSIVSPRFWHLSLLGNVLLMTHAFIQFQYHVCVIQAWNTIISWRNLNLRKMHPLPKKNVYFFLLLAIGLISVGFMIQTLLLKENSWFRVPYAPWQTFTPAPVPFFWHVIGFSSYFLFSSRFWIQWWLSEKSQASILPPSFWWISLGGALLSSLYFIKIQDSVNLIGPVIGMIPYIRNLILIHKSKHFPSSL
jgi:lipid-A-disaccharide synthase-like uncharacterized protein